MTAHPTPVTTPPCLPLQGFDEARWEQLVQSPPTAMPWSALPDSVERTSLGRPWPGLLFWHQVGPAGDLYVPATLTHTVLVRRGQPTLLQQRQGTLLGQTQFEPGHAVVVPAGTPSFWRSSAPRDNLHIALEPSWLMRLAQDDVQLQSSLGRNDAVLAGFAQVLWAALDNDCSLNPAFGEHVAQAIAIHLLSHYAQPQAALRTRAWLTRRQLQRLEEAVHAQLAANWTVERLAREVGLSTYHFARAFKAACGLTPHAWLSQQRMNAAAHLVRHTAQPLAEIAQHTGHRSAAHFAQVFRRHWGLSPSTYRRGA